MRGIERTANFETAQAVPRINPDRPHPFGAAEDGTRTQIVVKFACSYTGVTSWQSRLLQMPRIDWPVDSTGHDRLNAQADNARTCQEAYCSFLYSLQYPAPIRRTAKLRLMMLCGMHGTAVHVIIGERPKPSSAGLDDG